MKYAKTFSPPRVPDELINRGLVGLNEELDKIARVINRSPRIDIRDYGAKEGSNIDNHSALVASIIACPVGETIYIPEGKWELETQLDCDKQVNLVGDGIGSIIWLKGGAAVDGIVVGNASTYTYGLNWKNFAILGGADSCKNGLILRKVNNSRFENIHVLCGTSATGAAVWIQWAIVNYYNFYISTNMPYPETGVAPIHGIKVTKSDDGATVSNANEFDCIIEGVDGKGLYIRATGGYSDIRGTYEGIEDYAIHIKGGRETNLHDVYLEATGANKNELVIEDHEAGIIGDGVVSHTAGGGYNDVQLINSVDTLIEGLTCNRLGIDSDCSDTKIQKIDFRGASDQGLYDSGVNTAQIFVSSPAYLGRVRESCGVASDFNSLVENGSVERWTAVNTRPPGSWNRVGSEPAWAREATIVKHGTYSAKITTDTTKYPCLEVTAAKTTLLSAGALLTVSGWIYIPTTGGNDVVIRQYWSGGGTTQAIKTITTRDVWTKVCYSYMAKGLSGSETDSRTVFIQDDTIMYLDGFSIVPSVLGGSVFYTPKSDEFPIYTGTAAWNPSEIAASGFEAGDFACPGAASGMVASAGAGVDVTDLIVSATVTVADVVTVVLFNPTGSPINLTSSTWTVKAQKLF